jgi:hypothetical protein
VGYTKGVTLRLKSASEMFILKRLPVGLSLDIKCKGYLVKIEDERRKGYLKYVQSSKE